MYILFELIPKYSFFCLCFSHEFKILFWEKIQRLQIAKRINGPQNFRTPLGTFNQESLNWISQDESSLDSLCRNILAESKSCDQSGGGYLFTSSCWGHTLLHPYRTEQSVLPHSLNFLAISVEKQIWCSFFMLIKKTSLQQGTPGQYWVSFGDLATMKLNAEFQWVCE